MRHHLVQKNGKTTTTTKQTYPSLVKSTVCNTRLCKVYRSTQLLKISSRKKTTGKVLTRNGDSKDAGLNCIHQIVNPVENNQLPPSVASSFYQ